MNKHKVHFHTDCPFFAGCENMLSVLFNNPVFRQNFDISFSYNYSEQYEEGLKKRISTKLLSYPLRLSKQSSTHNNLLKKFLIKFFRPFAFLLDSYKIYCILKKESPDLIHINNGGYPGALSCSAAVLSAKLAGINKIIYVVNNIAVPINSFSRLLLFPLDLFVKMNVTKFITGSDKAKDALINVLHLNSEKVIQIPNTIVPKNPTLERDEFRKSFGIRQNDFVIGCVALFTKRKGHKYLLAAFSQLLAKHTGKMRIYLFLDGDGEDKESIKKTILELNLEKNVFIINSSNIYNLYKTIDVLVLPSIEKEDFPNVILECMSMQKPIIGTNIGGIPEQIKDNYSGLIVPPGDSENLKNALSKLIKNKKFRELLGKNGKRFFETHFSESIIVNKYLELYKKMILN